MPLIVVKERARQKQRTMNRESASASERLAFLLRVCVCVADGDVSASVCFGTNTGWRLTHVMPPPSPSPYAAPLLLRGVTAPRAPQAWRRRSCGSGRELVLATTVGVGLESQAEPSVAEEPHHL